MKIIFLGTAGGRFAVLKQLRASGGIILEMDGEMIHIDPGPGALVKAVENRIDLSKLTGVIVTHTHPDHCSDAEIIIEAMTAGTKKKNGVLVANRLAFEKNHNEHYIPIFCKYHLKALKKYRMLRPGDSARIGKVKVTAVKTKHRDSEAIGIIFQGTKRVGYTSDSEYFEGLEDFYRGCDYLIINCLRSRKDPWPEHMNSEGAEKIITSVRPKKAILTHIGIRFMKDVYSEASMIKRSTGVDTIVAKDNMVLVLD